MGVSCDPDSCIEFVFPYWFTSFEHLYTTIKPYVNVIFVCIFHLKNKQLNKSQQFYFYNLEVELVMVSCAPILNPIWWLQNVSEIGKKCRKGLWHKIPLLASSFIVLYPKYVFVDFGDLLR